MQISDDVYVEIEIPDMKKSSFLSATDLYAFRMVEAAGVSLPYIIMKIKLFDTDIVNCFQQNNQVLVKVGTTAADADTFPVIIEKADIDNDPSGSGWIIDFGGFLYSRTYRVNQESAAYTGTSLDVVKQVYKEEVGKPVVTTVSQVFENEVTWRRIHQSACSFLINTFLHMRLYPSFPLFAIDKYGNLIIKDFKAMCKEGPKYTLAYYSTDDYKIYNNFNVENNRNVYNLCTGDNMRMEVLKSSEGKKSVVIAENKPILASAKVSEGTKSGSTVESNEIQSANVHDWYKETYVYNTNNQIALSSVSGDAVLIGRYHKEMAPLDLVKIDTGKEKSTIDGLYLVEQIETVIDPLSCTFYTNLKLSRDNKNYIENYVKKDSGFNVQSKFMQDLCAAVADLRTAYAIGQKFIDGEYMARLLSFALESKRNILRMFSIAGVSIDFNSSALLVKSFLLLGNSLMNTLVSMIFPAEIAQVFRDYLIRKPSLKALLMSYIDIYVPTELQSVIYNIVNSLDNTTNTLNSIAQDNGVIVTEEEEMAKIEDDTQEDVQQKTVEIIDSFADNTEGIDIPFPLVDLTETQRLLPDDALKDYIADETIINLTNLGYMEGVDTDEFKKVLVGEEKVSFDLINKIKANAGNTYNYRFWGTYSDLINLTSFTVKQSYKDKYRTIPCTKLISARGGVDIFFACPRAETNLKFYINSTRVDLPNFEVSLGYQDSAGNDIPYLVYYTENGNYNSSSVLFEVKQGGMS